ncbi:MAG: LON peptidase substrate-binding domain-containing protein [Tepidisphaeraceae bacterium]|jgi:Lon protease-like protein
MEPCDQPVLSVALFPLPDVVLFPCAILPLHIFEQRYRVMTAEALADQRLLAMALLKPGWETDYDQAPAIEPVVCVGQILNFEKLPDGRYHLLLQGQARARILEETGVRPFRTARVEVFAPSAAEIDLVNQRERLMELVRSLPQTAQRTQLHRIVASPLSTSDVADLLAFNFVQDVASKQSLLAEKDVTRRISRLIEILQATWQPLLGRSVGGLHLN